MRKLMREWAVVGEEQCAGRVGVEATDRDDAFRKVDEFDDGPATLRIGCRRHRRSRLVQEDVGEALGRDLPAVHLDTIGGFDMRVQLSSLAVDPHTSGLDQLVGRAPRGDSRAGEIRVQTHP